MVRQASPLTMPWKYTDEYCTEYTRTTWNQAAEPYLGFMSRLKPFHQELVHRIRPRRAENILDLACGPGEPAISLAQRVGKAGHVVGVDLSEKMIKLARRSARTRGLANISFRLMNCEKLRLQEASFDAATCAFGFQIFTNPEKAAAETHRVVKPGGRVACCIWRHRRSRSLHSRSHRTDARPRRTGREWLHPDAVTRSAGRARWSGFSRSPASAMRRRPGSRTTFAFGMRTNT